MKCKSLAVMTVIVNDGTHEMGRMKDKVVEQE